MGGCHLHHQRALYSIFRCDGLYEGQSSVHGGLRHRTIRQSCRKLELKQGGAYESVAAGAESGPKSLPPVSPLALLWMQGAVIAIDPLEFHANRGFALW